MLCSSTYTVVQGNVAVILGTTVIIRILRVIRFNIRNSVSGIYDESNLTEGHDLIIFQTYIVFEYQ